MSASPGPRLAWALRHGRAHGRQPCAWGLPEPALQRGEAAAGLAIRSSQQHGGGWLLGLRRRWGRLAHGAAAWASSLAWAPSLAGGLAAGAALVWVAACSASDGGALLQRRGLVFSSSGWRLAGGSWAWPEGLVCSCPPCGLAACWWVFAPWPFCSWVWGVLLLFAWGSPVCRSSRLPLLLGRRGFCLRCCLAVQPRLGLSGPALQCAACAFRGRRCRAGDTWRLAAGWVLSLGWRRRWGRLALDAAAWVPSPAWA